MNDQALAVGTFTDVQKINAILRDAASAASQFHLITPAPLCPRLPLGCVVGFQAIAVDHKTETHDVGGGKRSLTKTALWRLSNAFGISFHPRDSRKIHEAGDPVHPFYAHFRAVAVWRDLSTSFQTTPGNYQLDLRDGTAATQKVLESAEPRLDKETGEELVSAAEMGRRQLLYMRAKILERAQSGAEHRAIRKACGIRTYTVDELIKKPFLVVRLMFVGSGDLEDRRAIRSSFLNSHDAMFGSGSAVEMPAPMAAEPEPLLCDYCGSSVGVRQEADRQGLVVQHCESDRCTNLARGDIARNAPPDPPPPPPPTPKPETRPRSSTETSSRTTSSSEEHLVKFGYDKGKPLSKLAFKGLRWYRDAIAHSIDNPDKAQWRSENQAIVRACDEELRRRQAHREQDAATQDPPPDLFGDDDIPY